MPVPQGNDTTPPPGWSSSIIYLIKSRLSPTFPPALIPLLFDPKSLRHSNSSPPAKYTPKAISHPTTVIIRPINQVGHPAHGQAGLFARQKIPPKTLIIPYLGILHASLQPEHSDTPETAGIDEEKEGKAPDPHESSDYDLSLLRISSSDPRNPFPGNHVSIGVDAATMGNAARFVNDYRGIKGSCNAEFRLGIGESGELRMEIWSLKEGVGKGEEILVSYGKSWWGSRRG